jgi:calcium/calmodulin-dependent protein kinase (CaM kinase) II/calcium/calmodulin-dependent protein kinase I
VHIIFLQSDIRTRGGPKTLEHRHRAFAQHDIKPDNLLFDGYGGALRLGDFGPTAWFVDGRSMMGLVGTPYYVAPMVVAGRKVDVWSAGVVST